MTQTNDKESQKGNFSFKKGMRIFAYLKPYRGKFALGILFLLLSSSTSMVFPGLMGKLMDASTVKESDKLLDLSYINDLFLLLLMVFFIQAIFSFFRIYLFSDVTERMMASLRQQTYRHLIQLPMSFFAANRVGELNSRISSDIAVLQETFTSTIAQFLRQIVTITVGIALLGFYSLELTLLLLLLLPILVGSALLIGRRVRGFSKKAQSEIAHSNTIVEETLTGIANVKAFTNEHFETLRYRKSTDRVKNIAMQNAVWRAAFASFVILALFGSIVFVIWYGVGLKEAGELTLGNLVSFIIYAVFVGGSFGGVAEIYTQIQKAVGATESLMDLLKTDTEQIDAEDQKGEKHVKGDVAFERVDFHYPSRPEITVLDQLSFDAKSGQNIAIVGPSGAGKSTIASLLLRFYDPVKGRIAIDGVAIKSIPLQQLRNTVGIVPQEVLLFGGSIMENIQYGRPNATREEVIDAAKKANAHDFIESFSEGYQTIVGERGIRLSGGQKQRIAIARTVLKNPAILVLDEATSSLDSQSEKSVQDALEKLMKGRTSFVIAHRLSTVKNADRILVLDRGRLVEYGTHDELIADENSLYKNLSRLQFAQS